MERNQKQTISIALSSRIIISIILLLLLVHIGFYRTYIRFFPAFADYVTPAGRNVHFGWVKHFHGMMMMGWTLMLLLQPILILKGKIKWHHRVGSLSYVLAPLVLLSMWWVTQDRFLDIVKGQGYSAGIAHLSLNFPNIIFFALLYSLAIYYRKRSALHIPFMLGTGICSLARGLPVFLLPILEYPSITVYLYQNW